MPWFLIYIIPTVVLFAGYAWLVGSTANDPPKDGAIFPLLFICIIVWPVTIATVLVVLPFVAIAAFAEDRARKKSTGGESGT